MPDRISNAARRRLRDSGYFALWDIDCDHRDGVLTLGGRLPTYYLKQLAQACVADVPGVRAVVNRVEVTTSRPREGAAP